MRLHLNEAEHRWQLVDFGPQPMSYCSGCDRMRPVDPWDACLDVDHGTGFYEDDEPAGKIRAEWAATPKGLTGMWHEPDGCGHGDACESCTD